MTRSITTRHPPPGTTTAENAGWRRSGGVPVDEAIRAGVRELPVPWRYDFRMYGDDVLTRQCSSYYFNVPLVPAR